LGVLLSAGELRLIEPGVAYRQLLTETTFRTSAELEAQFFELMRPRSELCVQLLPGHQMAFIRS
jgi:hypothetical protein